LAREEDLEGGLCVSWKKLRLRYSI
jgi:hypothetical protein